jgi:hypothetical protein
VIYLLVRVLYAALYAFTPAMGRNIRDPVHRIHVWTGPEVSWRLRLPGFLNNRRTKLVKLSAVLTGRLYPYELVPALIFVSG